MKKVLLLLAVVLLLTSPLAAKKKIGFGMTIATGPMWILAGGGGIATVADSLVMNLDLHLGVNFRFSKRSRLLLGFAVRPLIMKGGVLATEVLPLKVRATFGIISVYGGLGAVVMNGGSAFASNFGFGFMINIGKHFGIMLDLLDTSFYVGRGGSLVTVNSLVGFNLYF